MAFVCHSLGKRYVWECNDRQLLITFLKALSTACFKPARELERVFDNLNGTMTFNFILVNF